MVNVSQNFMNLALAPGRNVYCKIVVGNEVFLDDKILEFDFDDVIHPDWVTIGTTCANRFSFSAEYENEIAVHTEVKPYISFDGSEWCPLGIFYVARRYIRGKYASIICYDRMYSLDMEYTSSLTAPTRTADMLREICSAYEIPCEFTDGNYKVEKIPSGCTVRDVIGYIAILNYGCAKFDRSGKLVIKSYHSVEDFILQPENVIDFSRNMSASIIRHITVDTGDKTLETGDGSELTSLELYSPMITQNQLDTIRTHFLPLSFYGAILEMQGLPFLESGEYILFEETPGRLYPLALSEIEYHYDGALTAKLYSKNRSYTDAAVHQDDLEAALAEIRAGLGNIYFKQTNEQALTLGTDEVTAADFEFDTKKADVFAQIDLNFTVDGGGSNMLAISVYVNGSKDRTSYHTVDGSTRELVHFYYLAEKLPKGKNRITVTISSASGQMTIQAGQLIATLVGKGMAGGTSNYNDRLTITELWQTFPLSFEEFTLSGLSDSLQT